MSVSMIVKAPDHAGITRSIGDKAFKDTNVREFSVAEARLAAPALAALIQADEIRVAPGQFGDVKVVVGEAVKTLSQVFEMAGMDLPEVKYVQSPGEDNPAIARIKTAFNNETAYANFRRMLDQTTGLTQAQLDAYATELEKMKGFLGSKFSVLLVTPFRGNEDNIVYKQEGRLYDGGIYKDSDAYNGFLLDTSGTVANYMNAIFYKGGDHYGPGEIEAPSTACSKVTTTYNKHDVVQQLVFDIPWPIPNKMTQNRTKVLPYGGIGMKVAYRMVKDDKVSWVCLDTSNKGTDFAYNRGWHSFLPIGIDAQGNPIGIYAYGTESDVSGVDAPDSSAESALRENMRKFYEASNTEKYGGTQPKPKE
jgi:hypothetical protein